MDEARRKSGTRSQRQCLGSAINVRKPIGLIGRQAKFNMSVEVFPLLATRAIFFPSIFWLWGGPARIMTQSNREESFGVQSFSTQRVNADITNERWIAALWTERTSAVHL